MTGAASGLKAAAPAATNGRSSGTGAPVLEVFGLTVDFGGVRAVDDVSFDAHRGRIVGFVGPNGAGKTTLFDAIGGFVGARGRVLLGGRDISGEAAAARARAGLGRSFQDAKLFPSLTVFDTLACAYERHIRAEGVVSTVLSLPWVRRGERHVREKVEDLIGLMGLGAFRDKFVSELSTGTRRIVDLAVIVAHDPSVLLLDEPSSGIAQRETEALAPLLVRIRDETGAALLVVEHDMPLIRSISDEIIALETGRVLTQGRPEVVLDDPRLVEAYLGTNQAVVQRSGGAALVATGPRRTPARKKAAASTNGKVPAGDRAGPSRAAKAAKKASTRPAASSTRSATSSRSAASSSRSATSSRSAASSRKRAPKAKGGAATATTQADAKTTPRAARSGTARRRGTGGTRQPSS
jgi:ABC-type branched-subunit amino acid transport system ATPase component